MTLPSVDPVLDALRTGRPVVVLTGGQATAQAMRLRALGLPYSSIAKVMDRYHGIKRAPTTWRDRCIEAGAQTRPWLGNPRWRDREQVGA